MATIQTSYTENIADAREGMIANQRSCEMASYEVEDTAGIGFGVAVHQGTSSDQISIGVDGSSSTPFAVTKYVGITVRDRTRVPGDDEYKKGAIAAVLIRGDIWVKVGAAVSIGDDVTVVASTGVLSSTTAADDQHLIPNARFLTAASANKLALLRLGTDQVGGA